MSHKDTNSHSFQLTFTTLPTGTLFSSLHTLTHPTLTNSMQRSESYGSQSQKKKGSYIVCVTPVEWQLHGRICGAQQVRPYAFSEQVAGSHHVGIIVPVPSKRC